MDASNILGWLVPYTSGLFKVESMCLNYLTKRRDCRHWVGPIEGLIALSYLRFRPGAKLNFRELQITNDHSHQINIRSYHLDFQGIKRFVTGSDASQLWNLKTPIYYSYQLLEELDESDREILLRLALQSVGFMMENTYSDLAVRDYLQTIRLLLKNLIQTYCPESLVDKDQALERRDQAPSERGDQVDQAPKERRDQAPSERRDQALERRTEATARGETLDFENTFPNKQLEEYLCLKPGYQDHPLTVENLRLWRANMPLLKDICHQFKQANERYFVSGGVYDENLNRIRKGLDRVREDMQEYVDNLEKI